MCVFVFMWLNEPDYKTPWIIHIINYTHPFSYLIILGPEESADALLKWITWFALIWVYKSHVDHRVSESACKTLSTMHVGT